MEDAFLDSPSFSDLIRGLASPSSGSGEHGENLGDLGDLEDLPYVILELPALPALPTLPVPTLQQPAKEQTALQTHPLAYEADFRQQPSVAFYEADFLGTPEEGQEHIKKNLGIQSFKVRKPRFPYKPSSLLTA